jgi:predicted acyl esterase
MEPRQVYAITIEPFATANLFRQGHRIRLDIASSNFPKFDVNPQSGEAEGSARRRVVATNTVFVDAARPSQVVLQIVPSAALRSLTPA